MRNLQRRQMGRTGSVLTLLVAVSLLGMGCGGENAPDTAAMLYEVQGVIQQLPDPAKAGSELQISHEAIPAFVSSEGKVVGMNAMTMPFPVVETVSLDGFEIGDTVTFSLEVQWDRSPAFLITRLERVEAKVENTPQETSAPTVDEESTDSAEEAAEEEHHEH